MLFLICLQSFGLLLIQQGAHPAQVLRPRDVETAVRASLADIAPDAEIQIVECSQTPLSGRIEFPLSGAARVPSFHPERPFLWRGKVISESGSEYPAWARVRLVTKRKVVRTLVDLSAGTVLKPEQMESVEGLANPLLKQKDETPADYAGLCLKRSLPALSRLGKELVEIPPLVRRGSRVEVEAIAGKTRLKFEAEAHANGRMGDRIELTNLHSGRPFWGTVSGPGSVLIAISR
jgi:flagella basal body P-ring formation protein FlgA